MLKEAVRWLRKFIGMKTENLCGLISNDSDFDLIREDFKFQQLLEEFCGKW